MPFCINLRKQNHKYTFIDHTELKKLLSKTAGRAEYLILKLTKKNQMDQNQMSVWVISLKM